MYNFAQHNYTSYKLLISVHYLKTDVINQNIHNLLPVVTSAA